MPTVESAGSAVADRLGARPGDVVRDVASGFQEHRVLIEGGAVAFRCVLALITGALCLLGVLGILGLETVWTEELAPPLRENASAAAFTIIDDAVLYVLTQEQLFWATAGLAIAIWQASSVVRAVGELLNRIYAVDETRSWKRVMLSSIGLGAVLLAIITAALAAVMLAGLGVEQLLGGTTAAAILGDVVRWALAAALLLLAVSLTVRGAPNIERPFRWITLGSAFVVGGWLLTSLAFGVYLTVLADYSSVFGNVATVFLLIEYLFVGSVVFLVGLLVDGALERRNST